MPSAYQPFSPAIALRSYEGSDWYTIIDMRSPYQDEFGNPLMHAGDEIEYSVDIFIEGSDTENLPGGNAARMVAKLDKDPEDTTVGIVLDSDVIISASEYNEAELMMDEEHYYEPYKRFTRSFTIPEDSESEEKVQSTGFKMLVGTHMLPKEDYPFRIYSMTLYNISTDTVILYADADSLSTTAAQGAREALTDEDILGGIAGKRVNGYGDSVLVNGGFETLPAGMYSYEFFYTTIGNNGVDKAALSAVTENGTVLNSKIVTDYYNGVYKTTRLVFSVTEETKVGFKIDLYNNTDFYLKSVTLNQMLSASEVAIQRVINAINELPSVEDLTLDNATAVASVQRLYDRLTDEQKAAVTNAEKLEAGCQ